MHVFKDLSTIGGYRTAELRYWDLIIDYYEHISIKEAGPLYV